MLSLNVLISIVLDSRLDIAEVNNNKSDSRLVTEVLSSNIKEFNVVFEDEISRISFVI